MEELAEGTLLFANNDASNVMQMDPATGLARVIHSDVNTGEGRLVVAGQ